MDVGMGVDRMGIDMVSIHTRITVRKCSAINMGPTRLPKRLTYI